MRASMVDIQSATAEIRRGKKRRRKEDRNHRAKIQWSALLHRATIKISLVRDWRSTVGWLSITRDLDLEIGSGHTAYRRASLIDLYLHAKFHSNRKNFLWMGGRTDGHFRPPLIWQIWQSYCNWFYQGNPFLPPTVIFVSLIFILAL